MKVVCQNKKQQISKRRDEIDILSEFAKLLESSINSGKLAYQKIIHRKIGDKGTV